MGALLAGKHPIQPFHHEGLTKAGDRRRRCLQTFADCAIRPAFAARPLVGFQKDARLAIGARWKCRLPDLRKQGFTLIQRQLNSIFDVCQNLSPGTQNKNRKSEHEANRNYSNSAMQWIRRNLTFPHFPPIRILVPPPILPSGIQRHHDRADQGQTANG